MYSTSIPAVLAAALSFSTLVSAQQMLDFSSGALPACAQQCSALNGAQDGCIPGPNGSGAPVSSPATYKSCFCQSSILVAIRGGQNTAICNDVCTSTTDLAQIGTWYKSYCDSSALPAASGSAAPTTAVPTGAAPAATGPSTTDSTNDDGGAAPVQTQGSWWDKHGKWIAMVIVLIVGFGIIIGVSLWYKKRYYRRRANTLREPQGWNPHDSGHYGGYPGSTEKVMGSRSETASPAPVQQHGRGGSIHRLSKLVGR